MDVFFVDQRDVFGASVVALQDLHVVILYLARFFRDALVCGGDILCEKPLPFVVGEGDVVQQLQMAAQVGDKPRFRLYLQPLIPLSAETVYEVSFQIGLALVIPAADSIGDVFGDDGGFARFGDDVIRAHGETSLNVSS